MDPTVPPEPTPGDWIPSGNVLDFSHTGIRWLDNLIDALVIAMIVLGVVATVWRLKVKPLLVELSSRLARTEQAATQAQENSAIARNHTENSHADSPYPNLRDDLDAKHDQTHQELMALTSMVARLEEGQKRQDKELSRINDVLLDDRQAARVTAEALAQHIHDKRDYDARLTRLENKQ